MKTGVNKSVVAQVWMQEENIITIHTQTQGLFLPGTRVPGKKKKLERKQRGWRNDMPMVSELILKVHIKSLICRNLYQCLDTVILSFFSVLVSQMQALYPPPSSFFLASPGSTWTSWRMRGRLVTTPVPLGSKSLPTRLSSTELFPLLC